jgi:divalent metal cation (Fe/Co/Zn/Cd) transporter
MGQNMNAIAGSSITDPALVRRGLWLNYATIGYNTLEAIMSVAAGAVSGSVVLVGFGIDSVIEVSSSVAAQWRLRAERDPQTRERIESITLRVIGWLFLSLAIYIAVDAGRSLLLRERPEGSIIGIVILALSIVVMPFLARAKRRVATGLGSRALNAEAAQTALCAYLSVIALAGVVLNALFGWWWADPVAALGMVPIIAREGVEGMRGAARCDDC